MSTQDKVPTFPEKFGDDFMDVSPEASDEEIFEAQAGLGVKPDDLVDPKDRANYIAFLKKKGITL